MGDVDPALTRRPVAEQATKTSARLAVEVVTGLAAEAWFLTASRVLLVEVVARNAAEGPHASEALSVESAQLQGRPAKRMVSCLQCTVRKARAHRRWLQILESGCQGPTVPGRIERTRIRQTYQGVRISPNLKMVMGGMIGREGKGWIGIGVSSRARNGQSQ